MKSVITILLSLFLATGASAQNQLGGPIVIAGVSPAQMASILQSLGLQSSVLGYNEGNFLVEGSVENESVYVLMSECTSAEVNAICSFIGPFGAFDTSGVTLNALNTFNMSMSDGSVAGILPDGSGLMGMQLRTSGGVTPENFGNDIAYFFSDLESFLSVLTSVNASSVSLETAPAQASLPAGFEALSGFMAGSQGLTMTPLTGPQENPLLATDGVKGLLSGNLPAFPMNAPD